MWLLSRLSLANRSLVALITVVIIGFGAFSIPSLRQQLLPSLEFPIAAVLITDQGASPQVVEEQVTTPIEDAIQAVPNLESVTSTSQSGSATVLAQFEYGTDLDDATNKIEQAVNRIDAQLPDNAQTSVFAGSTDSLPVVTLAASGSLSQQQLGQRLTDTVAPKLRKIDGVKDADITGVRDQQVTITPDAAKLAKAGVPPTAVVTALQGAGARASAGTLTEGDKSLSVQVGGKFDSVQQIKNLYLSPAAAAGAGPQGAGQPGNPGQQGTGSSGATGQQGGPQKAAKPVRLGDVASVKVTESAATSLTRTNGKPSLGVSITMKPDGNAVAISKKVRDELSDLKSDLGPGGELTIVSDQAPYVQKSIKDLFTEGMLGLVFAVVVILIFLLSVRATLVTVVSIPVSVMIALLVMWLKGDTLNLLTLGGLTIAIGRVVDDSIVVLENVKRHLGYGESKRDAVLSGVREVAGAVTSSTLTTVAVFLPIGLVGGMVGELFAPFAITVVVALLASLLVALTITPVLAYWFLKAPKRVSPAEAELARQKALEKERRSPLQRAYVPVIRFATRHRFVTVLIAVVVFVGTLALAPGLKTNLLDSSGQDTLSLSEKMPVGTSLSATSDAAEKIEGVLRRHGDIKSYQATVGSTGFGTGSSNQASFQVTVTEGTDTDALSDSLRHDIDELSGVGEVTFGDVTGFGASNVQVVVTAPDDATLRTAASQVEGAFKRTGQLRDVESDLSPTNPQVQVTVDHRRAAQYGLTDTTITQLVQQAFQGAPAAKIELDGADRNVIVRTGAAPATMDKLKALPVPTATGTVPLSAVATVKRVNGPVTISHTDRNRSATVSATATSSNTGQVTSDLTKKLDALKLPTGADWSMGGVGSDQSDAFRALGIALLAAIAIVFIIMVATFRSLLQPLILLVSVPFAATGAIVALLASNTALGVASLIGLLMLIGIVVTNAIVLMDLINQYRRQGMTVAEAVVEGGRRRLRPILMTAAATICALIPMSLGLTGKGGFISQPLAIVVIGGLVSSTLLTLLLVPALYTMVEGRREKRRLRREAAEATPDARCEPAAAGAQ
ncbi:efflux RND transporter permease subunit [Actinocatenispora sera]|uniref:Hydrogenase expression protein n=1 Tax=Actinocatenispora sera TaxID=390989 RepID=A0A810L6N1_9ACTN|nr:efflux RND transporter permease subunit [Actinocatenispora sera]BCJ29758.1 hydrogenase expression protein [Actinocatenispora sera]